MLSHFALTSFFYPAITKIQKKINCKYPFISAGIFPFTPETCCQVHLPASNSPGLFQNPALIYSATKKILAKICSSSVSVVSVANPTSSFLR